MNEMPAAPTVEDFEMAVAALKKCEGSIPRSMHSLRSMVRAHRLEHARAVKMFLKAAEDERNPRFAPIGGIARGEFVMLPGGQAELRRTTPTGVELVSAGFSGWTNITSQAAPFVVVNEDES